MKKTNIILLTVFAMIGFTSMLSAQNQYHIRLQPLAQSNPALACYQIQLASANQGDLNLAGQNYRMYYNSAYFHFNPAASKSLLPAAQYTELIIKDNLMDIDAMGAGVLPFEENLGFLNFGNDLDDLAEGGIILPATEEWVSTAQACFDKVNQEIMPSTNAMELVWARPELTAAFATAYVEMSEWTAPFQTNAIAAASYNDMSFSTGLSTPSWANTVSVFPNPTKGKTVIEYDANERLELTIYSINGTIVKAAILTKGTNSHTVDLALLPVGTYLVKLSNGVNTFSKKIEKIN